MADAQNSAVAGKGETQWLAAPVLFAPRRVCAMAKTPYTLQFCVEDKLRNLSRMLACLDRIGKDLYLEAANGQVCCFGLWRRHANRSKSWRDCWSNRRLCVCRAGLPAHAQRRSVRVCEIPLEVGARPRANAMALLAQPQRLPAPSGRTRQNLTTAHRCGQARLLHRVCA
eukprot:scaffold4173_cov117-Isochrysis_galbana.AAC.15